jgi:tryptophan 2,3-dioxygenase
MKTEESIEITPRMYELLGQLERKYETMGQNMEAYIEGLLHADYTTYWDYIHTDALLALQTPRTSFPDEMVFIMYHQITELYFKLTLHEMEQICRHPNITKTFLLERMKRVNAYFDNLTASFKIMIDGMEPEQFLKFRMSLLPASGFQSYQYRAIEICSTNFVNLVGKDYRDRFTGDEDIDAMFDYIYWKSGATELATGKKTLTLTQFERKYTPQLKRLANEYRYKNIWERFKNLNDGDEELVKELRHFDLNVNVNWPMVHMRSAARYLQKPEGEIAATGGTNWQKYLAPRMQFRIFFPQLWSDDEKTNWGTSTVTY